MVRVAANRVPIHPGEMLLEEFLEALGDDSGVGGRHRCAYQRVNEIVNGRRCITPSTALRL